jgi:hypothetical protein
MYVGLWSRLEGFARDQLTRALERRTVVQGTLMRSTIHLVSRADYWPFAVAVRGARRTWWLRVRRGDPDAAAMEAAVAELGPRLAAGPMRRADVEALVGRRAMEGVHLWLDLVRAPPSGTWERRRADLFALAEDWLGPGDVLAADTVAHVVSRYLRAFGPASRADVESWSGLGSEAVVAALDSLGLRRFRAEDGTELLDVPRAPLPDPQTPAPVRFLPTWDATLLVHARRAGILTEEHRAKVFSSRNPHSFPTFLVDGAVAGTWRHERGRIRLEPFGRLDAATRRALDREAEGLAALHA